MWKALKIIGAVLLVWLTGCLAGTASATELGDGTKGLVYALGALGVLLVGWYAWRRLRRRG